MKIKNQKLWGEYREKNKDPYGERCVDYAECWADLMEDEIDNKKTIANIAENKSNEADTDGITGFMYNMAKSILFQCWEYGDELQQYYKQKEK